MASLFSKIVAGEIPCYKVAETDKYMAFLDINPLKRGHTLCIPKVEVDHLFDLDSETYTGLMQFSQQVAKAIQKTLPYKRVGMVVAGFEVPHAHVHLIPVNNMQEMDFNNPKVQMVKEEFSAIAMAIGMAYKAQS
jgi:histidine triad (HIT) family protein